MNMIGLVGLVGYLMLSASGAFRSASRQHEISFQEFRTQLLAQGKVQRLEVANGSTVKVGRPGAGGGGVHPHAGRAAASLSPSPLPAPCAREQNAPGWDVDHTHMYACISMCNPTQ